MSILYVLAQHDLYSIYFPRFLADVSSAMTVAAADNDLPYLTAISYTAILMR